MAFEPATHELDQGRVLLPRLVGTCRCRNGRIDHANGVDRLELPEALGRDPEDAFLRSHQRGTARLRQFDQPVLPILTRISLRLGQEPEPDQRIVQLVRIGRIGPCLLAHTRYRCLVETAHLVGGIRIKPAPAHHRLRAALLERRVVEIGIRPCGEHLAGERRGLGQILGDDPDGARLDVGKQMLEAFDIHRLVEAIGNGLRDERMVGHLALAHQILGAGHLIGEDRAHQVLCHHAHELGRHLLAAAEAR